MDLSENKDAVESSTVASLSQNPGDKKSGIIAFPVDLQQLSSVGD